MTKIDFYVLKDGTNLNKLKLACIIAEKAYNEGHRIIIHTHSKDTADLVDNLLWTFKAESFIPHGKGDECDIGSTPIIIGDAGLYPEEADFIINLEDKSPEVFSRFQHLAECVDNDETSKENNREKYRYYRDRGYPLKMHNME
tara:strand:- start:330 stop:758 length:429 start_codon:yes stop_codon:yes gene_type:complete